MASDTKGMIWCEVSCSCCGATASASGYYSPERIEKLAEETKDWISTEFYYTVCPACQEVDEKETDKRTILGKRIHNRRD